MRNYKLHFTTIFILLLVFTVLAFLTKENSTFSDKLKNYYIAKLDLFQIKTKKLFRYTKENKSIREVKNVFFDTRINYKKAELIILNLNVYYNRLINGPAFKRTEEDAPETIYEPHGLQVIEEIIFSKKLNREKLLKECALLIQNIQSVQNNIKTSFPVTPGIYLTYIRNELINIAALGITGYDSPIASYSIPEAAAALTSVKETMLLLKDEKINLTVYNKMIALLTQAIMYASNNSDFNQFNRLHFLTTYINPISALVLELKEFFDDPSKNERWSVNPDAPTIFSSNAFNLDFFSPNQRYRVTDERIILGKRLFYDSILAINNNRSCVSCHIPSKAFADGLKLPYDVEGKQTIKRNTPTLWNVALQTRYFFDSRTSKLENQLSDVVHNPKEMGGSLKIAIDKLRKDSVYSQMFTIAYPLDSEKINQYTIANSISSYIRTLISFNSRFDKYMRGDKSNLSAEEKMGFNLFMGKGRCGTCHFAPIFNGLVPPLYAETESEILGVPSNKEKQRAMLDEDLGKYNYTKSVLHQYSFKTPTIRNIALTAPYMHNGVFNTLDEVMEFYNNGGGYGLNIAPDNQTLPGNKLNLTKAEIKKIIAFMQSLTDTSGSSFAKIINK
ncbi:MAG TPA: cytochrome c peroxidase [Chitinophagaceae bacterium]|nr:cytochrome c peroxidase [Chitinophagaceae bacterium]